MCNLLLVKFKIDRTKDEVVLDMATCINLRNKEPDNGIKKC